MEEKERVSRSSPDLKMFKGFPCETNWAFRQRLATKRGFCMNDLDFKVGFENFNDNLHLNFRINAWYNLGYLSYKDAKQAGTRIKNAADWKREFVELGRQAESENRLFNAAFIIELPNFTSLILILTRKSSIINIKRCTTRQSRILL